MFHFTGCPLLTLFDSGESDWTLLQPGSPIRISSDQSLLAAPRSLSQLIASFIGNQCHGIHPALLFAWSCLAYSFFLRHASSQFPLIQLDRRSKPLCLSQLSYFSVSSPRLDYFDFVSLTYLISLCSFQGTREGSLLFDSHESPRSDPSKRYSTF